MTSSENPSTKKTTAKKAAAKKTAAKKTAAKKTAAKTATVKKTAAAKKTAATTSVKNAGAKVAERARSAPMSQYFARARTRARSIIDDPEALQRVAQESSESTATRSSHFAAVSDDFRTLGRLVLAYAKRDYRDIGLESLVLVVAGLIYVVSPVDLIPDAIPGVGVLDDAMVIGWVVRSVRDELEKFRAWELAQGPS